MSSENFNVCSADPAEPGEVPGTRRAPTHPPRPHLRDHEERRCAVARSVPGDLRPTARRRARRGDDVAARP